MRNRRHTLRISLPAGAYIHCSRRSFGVFSKPLYFQPSGRAASSSHIPFRLFKTSLSFYNWTKSTNCFSKKHGQCRFARFKFISEREQGRTPRLKYNDFYKTILPSGHHFATAKFGRDILDVTKTKFQVLLHLILKNYNIKSKTSQFFGQRLKNFAKK